MFKLEDLQFCDAKISELEKIVEIYNSTVPSRVVTADTEPVTVESRIKWFNDHSADSRPIWVVKHKGQICGWLSFQSFYGRPAYNCTAELSIYISDDFKRKGLGRILLKKAIDKAPSLGLNNLLGFIFGHNEPSLKLFEEFGFEKWGFLPRVAVLDLVERDLVILGMRIQ